MSIKVGMVSLGCSKNQVDAEIMLSLLKKAGFEPKGEKWELRIENYLQRTPNTPNASNAPNSLAP